MAAFYPKPSSGRLGAVQNLTLSGTSQTIASAFGNETYQIAVSVSAAINMKIDSGTPSAAATDFLLPASSVT